MTDATSPKEGAIAGTANHSGGISAGLADIYIGWQSNTDNSTFNGAMDEIRIWNVDRSQAEIQNDRLISLIGNEANLVAYYRFDQGTAGVVNPGITTLPDKSQNQNDGTLTNFDMGMANVLISNWVNTFGPEIGVLDGVAVITDGQVISIDLGSSLLGVDIDKVITIENSGTFDLNITSITTIGP